MSFFKIESIIDKDLENDFLLVKLEGDVNIHYRVEMENFFNQKLRANYKDVIIDMEKVEYIDSIGLAVLINVYKKVVSQRKNFYFVGISEKVRKVFEMSGLNKILDMYPDLDTFKKMVVFNKEE
jgi:anti-anti-sigma factor